MLIRWRCRTSSGARSAWRSGRAIAAHSLDGLIARLVSVLNTGEVA
ncbi:MAG: hypothetical protein U0703_24400 [Anaerolineae bacterium]